MTATHNTAAARIEYRAPNTDRGAVTMHDGYTVFGRWEGPEFVVAYSKPGKSYKTAAGAERAARRWIAA